MKDILQFKHVSLQRQPVFKTDLHIKTTHLISLYLDLDIIKIDLLLRPLFVSLNEVCVCVGGGGGSR